MNNVRPMGPNVCPPSNPFSKFEQALLGILNAIRCCVCESEAPWVADQLVLNRVTATVAGLVPQNAYSVSIVNVGGANAVVDGEPLYPTQSLNLTAVQNPITKQYMLCPEVSYDATGTVLSISYLTDI